MEQAVPSAHSPAAENERRRVLVHMGVALVALGVVHWPNLRGLFHAWTHFDDYAHGLIVAPLAVAFAWQQRKKLRRAPLEGSWLGLVPLGAGTLALLVGSLGGEFMTLRLSLPLSLAGIVLLLAGRDVFRLLLFPIAFTLLMIPLPQALINVVAFPLQLIAAKWAVWSLQALGIPALLEGNIIHLAHTELFVAEACSGLRSLMALITLGVVFAHVVRRGHPVVQVVLVASTIPIAILVNAFRVGLTGYLAHFYGVGVTEGAIHEFQGFFTFGIALALLLVLSSAISGAGKVWRRRSQAPAEA